MSEFTCSKKLILCQFLRSVPSQGWIIRSRLWTTHFTYELDTYGDREKENYGDREKENFRMYDTALLGSLFLRFYC